MPDDGTVSKTFLYTSTMLNTQLWPAALAHGVGKNGSAYWLETAAATYQGRYKFYFVDERTPEGKGTMSKIDGAAHGLEFWKLAEEEKAQKHWCWTFVKGKGYEGNELVADREFRGAGIAGLPTGGISYDQFVQSATSKEELQKALETFAMIVDLEQPWISNGELTTKNQLFVLAPTDTPSHK